MFSSLTVVTVLRKVCLHFMADDVLGSVGRNSMLKDFRVNVSK